MKKITNLSAHQNKWFLYVSGGGNATREYGPYETKEDAKKAILPILIIGE